MLSIGCRALGMRGTRWIIDRGQDKDRPMRRNPTGSVALGVLLELAHEVVKVLLVLAPVGEAALLKLGVVFLRPVNWNP